MIIVWKRCYGRLRVMPDNCSHLRENGLSTAFNSRNWITMRQALVSKRRISRLGKSVLRVCSVRFVELPKSVERSPGSRLPVFVRSRPELG